MRGSRILAGAALAVLLLLLISPSSAWLDGYGYRQKHNLTGSTYWSANQTNYVMRFTANTGYGVSSGETIYFNGSVASDLDDLRFTDLSDTILDYWIAEDTTSSPFLVFVELNSLYNSSTATQMYVYYNNTTVSAYSNGLNTFPFFDNFADASLNTTRWKRTTEGTTTATITSGIIALQSNTGNANRQRIESNRTTYGDFGDGYQVTSRYTESAARYIGAIGMASDSWSSTWAPTGSFFDAGVAGGYSQPSYLQTDDGSTNAGSSETAGTYYLITVSNNGTYQYYNRNNYTTTISRTDTLVNSSRAVFASEVSPYNNVYTLSIDYIFNHKYIMPEPSHSSWYTLESAPTNITANFTSNVTGGYPPFDVQFNDTTAETVSTWYWDFGDGDTSTTRNATHTYDSVIGNTITYYSVYFNVSDGLSNYDWKNESNYITAYPLLAGFSANVTEGDAPLAVSFTDSTSQGTPTTWWWDFNEDGVCDDANQSPTYTFTSAGTYDIRLNVSNSYSYDWENKTDYVAAGGWLDGYCYRQKHNVTGTSTWSTNQYNYTMMFIVNRTSTVASSGQYLNLSSHAQSGLTDLRFTDLSGTTSYDFWVEEGTNTSTQYNVWVELPSITNSTTATQMYVYYGNASVSSASNGNNTFVFFDTFPGNSLDASKWSADWTWGSGGTVTVADSVLSVISNGFGSGKGIKSTSTFSAPYAMHERVKLPEVSGSFAVLYACMFTSGNTNPTLHTQLVNGFTENLIPPSLTSVFEADGSNLDQDYIEIDHSSYNTFVSYRNNTGYVDQYVNGTLVDSEHTYAYTSPTIMRYVAYCDGTHYVYSDWVFIRKYDNTEPSHSDWVAEESECCVMGAAFSGNVTSGYPGFAVQFTDSTTSPPADTWYWNFGDGETDTVQNPVHTYDAVIGNTVTSYTVSLNASNTSCSFDWENKTNYVTAYPLYTGFSANRTFILENGYVSFTDSTTNGTATAWDWDWGDGTAHGNTQNPTHQYTANGTYTVRMNASNSYSYDWENKTSYIRVLPAINSYDGIQWDFVNATTTSTHDNFISLAFLEMYNGELVFCRNSSLLATMNITTGVFNNSVRTSTGSGYTRAHVVDNKLVVLDENSPSMSNSYLYNTTDFITWTQWVSTTKNIGQDFAIGTDGLMYMSGSTMMQTRITRDDTTIWTGTIQGSDDGMATQCLNGVYVTQDAYPTNPVYSTNMVDWVDMWSPAVSGFPGGYNETYQFDWAWCSIAHDEYNIVIPSQAVNWAEHSAGFATFNTSTKEYLSYNLSKQLIGVTVNPDLMSGSDGVPDSYGDPLTTPAVIYRYNMGGTLGNKTMDWINGSVTQMHYNSTDSPYIWAVVADSDYEYFYFIRGTISLSADFTSNVTDGYPSFDVEFTDTTEGSPTAWDWDFGDGETDNVQNPVHTYDSVIGNSVTTYTVVLNASNAGDYDVETKTDYITAYPLNASFTANATSGSSPLDIQFTDMSDNGTATAWWWDFDNDGSVDSTDQNPIYTYNSAGTYTVNLNTSNSYSYDWENKTNFIVVSAPAPVANFTSNVTSGYPNFTVQFTDTSSNAPTDWDWYVDGVKVSDLEDPEYSFDDVIGNDITQYDVFLYAANGGGGNWSNRSDYITAYPLNASFGVNVTSGYQALAVQFTDYSDNGTPTDWYYDFGDGNTCITAQNPVNIYHNVGTYTVYQNVSNLYSYDWENKTYFIEVLQNVITADFTYNSTGGNAPVAVQFTDTSTADGSLPDTWNWYVNDVLNSTSQNPVITFSEYNQSTPICYTMRLNASNPYDYDWENKTMLVCTYPLNASFTVNTTSGCGPLDVEFTDLTDNGTPTWWNWSFGDGYYSDLQNPTHTYSSVGDFDVTLQVKYDNYTFGSLTQGAYIHVTGLTPTASFTSNVTDGYQPLSVQFNDTSGAGPATYYWDFGDLHTATDQNATHQYHDVIGNSITQYTVLFNISSGCSFDWSNQTNYITIYPLNASFSANVTNGDAPLVVGFTDGTNNGTPTTWWWDFNEDGIQDDANQSPTYIFGTPGVYNVTLNASNAYSYDWSNLTDYITVNSPPLHPPVASFTSNVTGGYPSFAVLFTDTSTESPTDWDWYVDGVKVSDLENPEYTFNDVIGNSLTQYDIWLYVANADGGDWQNETNYITAYPLNASFSGNPTIGNAPLGVTFTDLTDNGTPSAWYWQFGEGNESFLQNPGFTYNYDGLYNVTLNASNAYSWDIEEKLWYINVSANYTPTPTPTPTSGPTSISGSSTVMTANSASVNGFSYPMLILFIAGLALTAIVGLVVFRRD